MNLLFKYSDFSWEDLIILILAYIFFLHFYYIFIINRIFNEYFFLLFDNALYWDLDDLVNVNGLLYILLNRNFDYSLNRNFYNLIIRLLHDNFCNHILLRCFLNRLLNNDIVGYLNFFVNRNCTLNINLAFLVDKLLTDFCLFCRHFYVLKHLFLCNRWSFFGCLKPLLAYTNITIYSGVSAYLIRLTLVYHSKTWIHQLRINNHLWRLVSHNHSLWTCHVWWLLCPSNVCHGLRKALNDWFWYLLYKLWPMKVIIRKLLKALNRIVSLHLHHLFMRNLLSIIILINLVY